MTDKVLVLSTAGSEIEARKIAQELVERKLAACVNIVPKIQSVYRWQGQIESAEECMLLIKTTITRANEIQYALRELHSYEVPEFVVIPIQNGSEQYLNWISESVNPAGG